MAGNTSGDSPLAITHSVTTVPTSWNNSIVAVFLICNDSGAECTIIDTNCCSVNDALFNNCTKSGAEVEPLLFASPLTAAATDASAAETVVSSALFIVSDGASLLIALYICCPPIRTHRLNKVLDTNCNVQLGPLLALNLQGNYPSSCWVCVCSTRE